MRVDRGEEILFSGHPCWRSMFGFHVRWLVLAVLAGALAGAATTQASHVQTRYVALAVVVVFGFSLLRGVVRRAATTYTVTDQRLVIERGLVRRDLQEAPLWRIQNVFAHQTIRQRLLGIGSVHFDTAAGAEFDLCFRGVERPGELIRSVDRALHQGSRGAWEPIRV